MPVKSQLSGLIVQLLGFRTIANDNFPVKKGIQSLIKAVVQLNIKLLAGRFLKQEKNYLTDKKTPWQIKTESDLGFKLLSNRADKAGEVGSSR
jgi:uncharacterized membrane protein